MRGCRYGWARDVAGVWGYVGEDGSGMESEGVGIIRCGVEWERVGMGGRRKEGGDGMESSDVGKVKGWGGERRGKDGGCLEREGGCG